MSAAMPLPAPGLSLSDLVVVMRLGRIEQIGTPQEIYTCPRNLYTADFMGYSNKIPVTILEKQGREWLVKTDSGANLHATSTADAASTWNVGDQVLACSRPDEMLAIEKAKAEPDLNILSGIVHLSDYVGKAFELVVRLDGNEDQQVLIHSQQPLDMERQVTFGIHPDRLLLFPPDATVKTTLREPSKAAVQ